MASPATPLLDTSSDSFLAPRTRHASRRLSMASVGEAMGESTVANYLLGSARTVASVQSSFDDFSVLTGSGPDVECRGDTSWFAGVLIMANCTIGMGLLNFPHAFAAAGGVLPALATEGVVLVLILGSLAMLGVCVLRYGQVSFQAVVGHFLGPVGALTAKLLICVNNFGALVVLLVVLGDQIDRLAGLAPDACSLWYLDRRLLVAVLGLVAIFPLCLLSRFDAFKWTSFLGVLAAAYVAVGVALTRFITGVPGSLPSGPDDGEGGANLLRVIPIVCFSFECHVEVPPMLATLRRQSLSYFMRMAVGYVLLSASVYTVGGVCGFLTFGRAVPGDLLLGYSLTDPLVYVAMALLVLKIVTTYPILLFCLRLVLEDAWRRVEGLQRRWPASSLGARLAMSAPVFLGSLAIALVAPGITEVIDLIGSLSAVFVFVLPGLCFMQLMLEALEIHTAWRRAGVVAAVVSVLVGVFLFGSILTLSIINFATAPPRQPGRCG